jgi:hypothetical protein
LLEVIGIILIVLVASICSLKVSAISTEPTNPSGLDVKITFPPPRQQLPINDSLTIFGTASYSGMSGHCTVYASLNNLGFHKVVAVGPAKQNFSSWIFTFSGNDLASTSGINKIAAKLSCKASQGNVTAYYISNYTGTLPRKVADLSPFRNSSELSGSKFKVNSQINSHNNYVPGLPLSLPSLFLGNNNNLNVRNVPVARQLGVMVEVSKNPISWGDIQTVKNFVFDPHSNRPIPSALITGSLTRPGIMTGSTKDFSIQSDNSGLASYSWIISDNNQNSAVLSLTEHVYSNGYNSTTTTTKFTVMPEGKKIETHSSNSTNTNNIMNSPEISTIHAGT